MSFDERSLPLEAQTVAVQDLTPICPLSLYALTDLFSRYTVAWMVSLKENSALAQQLMNEAGVRYRIKPGQLT
ncbi:MAG: hypothetical protein AB8B96_19490, partial [Lysobacterales bacterium]